MFKNTINSKGICHLFKKIHTVIFFKVLKYLIIKSIKFMCNGSNVRIFIGQMPCLFIIYSLSLSLSHSLSLSLLRYIKLFHFLSLTLSLSITSLSYDITISLSLSHTLNAKVMGLKPFKAIIGPFQGLEQSSNPQRNKSVAPQLFFRTLTFHSD